MARRAERFAAPFGAELEARLTGLLHDAGKATERFHRRLQGKASGLDHWSPGAALALRRFRQHGIAASLAIEGHHLGLDSASRDSLKQLHELAKPGDRTLTSDEPERLLEELAAEGVELPELDASLYHQEAPEAGAMLDVRMLFAALVDADFLETEAHFDRDGSGHRRYRPEPPALEPGRALKVLEGELERLAETNRSRSAESVQRLRSDLLAACLEAAGRRPGPFTLSAPTGSGKTLSMLAFALKHAHLHGLRRVVMAVPYLSILEQTAQVYRDLLEPVFGAGYVLEHHSLAGTRGDSPEEDEQGPDAAEVLRRRQAENWDAPLVVTTSVQVLESLFANRPAPCRKLHRLADSVLLFDEVQTLPRPLAVATLATLSRLTERYGASVVFSTATQPSFEHLHDKVESWCASGWQPRELVPEDAGLFERSRRVEPEWRVGRWTPEDRLPWNRLADELAGEEQVLCILNMKRHARQLTEELTGRGIPGVLHLSTAMCPVHRQATLAEVRRRLEDGEPCRLVSTQCVEAGVDVDFPVVYRAFGPLDAIAQAAGRCNRNGTRPERGRLVVFLPDEPARSAYPGGDYQQAADVTQEVLDSLPEEQWTLESPALYDRWYRRLYDLARLGEAEGRHEREIKNAICQKSFSILAERYQLIPDDSVQVVVPWDRERFVELRRASEESLWITAEWMRRAQVHAVSLYRQQLEKVRPSLIPAPLGARLPEQRSEDWFVLRENGMYSETFGLGEPAETLMV